MNTGLRHLSRNAGVHFCGQAGNRVLYSAPEKTRRQMSYKAAGLGYAAASIFADALISGAAMVLNLNTRHA